MQKIEVEIQKKLVQPILHFCSAGECGYGAKLPRRKPNRVDLNFGRQLVDRGDHPEKGKNKDPRVDRLRLRGQHLVQRANILLPGLTDKKEPKKTNGQKQSSCQNLSSSCSLLGECLERRSLVWQTASSSSCSRLGTGGRAPA